MSKIHSVYGERPPHDGVTFTKPSRTKQSFAAETDINALVERAIATENYDIFQPENEPQYGDVSEYGDYHAAVQFVRELDEQFMELPSAVRKKFNNDAGQMYDFALNPDNYEESISLGILTGDLLPTIEAGGAPVQPALAPDVTNSDIPPAGGGTVST